MGETAPAIRIVFRTDVIPNLDRDGWAFMIFDRVNLETVRQCRVFERQRRNRYRTARGGAFRGNKRWRTGEAKESSGEKAFHRLRPSHADLFPQRESYVRRTCFYTSGEIGTCGSLSLRSDLVGLAGLEPATLRLSSACSNQLSYRPVAGGFGAEVNSERGSVIGQAGGRNWSSSAQDLFDCWTDRARAGCRGFQSPASQ